MVKELWCYLAVCMTLALTFGCKSQPSYELIPAKGNLKINGTPMANIMVQCMPDIMQGVKGPTSIGVTDSGGNFELKTEDLRLGAVPGKCIILLFDLEEERPLQEEVATKPSRLSSVYSTAKGGIPFEITPNSEINIDLPNNR